MLVKRLFVLLLLAVLVLPVRAQDTAQRDPAALARELLGAAGSAAIPPPVPLYAPGDSTRFWVSKVGQDAPTQIDAELAAAVSNVYLWVENGLEYDPAAMQPLAGQVGAILNILLIRDNYGQVRVIPRSAADFSVRAKLVMPDVDNDPHIFVLFASDLRDTSNVVYNPNHSLAAELAPGGLSSQHEILTVNTSALPDVPLHDPVYASLLARQIYAMLAYYNSTGQPVWLTDALSWYTLRQIQQADLTPQDIAPYLEAPNTGLLQPPGLGSGGQEMGARQLFLQYVRQRFGLGVLADLFSQPGSGLQPLDAALAQANITDLVTGDLVTADDVFADFVMANVLNGVGVGDGRYQYQSVDFGDAQASVVLLRDDLNVTLADGAVNQLGTRYIALTSATPTTVTLEFAGQNGTIRLPMPDAGGNQFYWAGASPNEVTTLARPFDLREVSQATLTFDAWHSLADGWNYAYVEVSQDDGATWTVLPATSTRTFNPYGAAYGPGFTGISNPDGPRPFPYLGVGLDADGLTISGIVPDGPAAASGLQTGDTIAGYDGRPWPGQPDLLGWLATHEAGEVVNLYVRRGSAFLEVPVTLGDHPTRAFLPDALWLPQSVDLSAYSGRNILLRFQTVSLPGRDNLGFAVDNLAIPQIGFRDDAEGGVRGWTLNGWRQTSSTTPQRFLLQSAHIGAGTASVRRLIAPGDTATSGTWSFALGADDFLILAISGLNDDTDQPARFALNLRAESSATPAAAP